MLREMGRGGAWRDAQGAEVRAAVVSRQQREQAVEGSPIEADACEDQGLGRMGV
jgi:hypothetical protein